ncbi:MAG: hypothetical protein AAB923_00015, partial [Patescibacteria group bacterium]
MKTPHIIAAVIVVALALGAYVVYSKSAPVPPGSLDGFAQCLKDNGAVFCGAYWCPHCQNQKKLFGTSAALLPFV